MEEALSAIKKPLSKKQLKEYSKYFDITDLGNDRISYSRNYEKIDEEKANAGIFLILSTDVDKNASGVFDVYRRKDLVEKCFDDLKNSIDMKRLRCHTKTTTDGKMFIAFISLILKSYLMNKLSDYFNKNNSTFDKVLREIRKIKAVTTFDGTRLFNSLTKIK